MSDSGMSFPDQPRVELDRRLAELVQAANEVLATQGRLRALLRANQAITARLDLESVLRSVVEAARELTGARYGALGVLGEHDELEQFVYAGMDESDAARIGRLPRGEGLLGAVIRDSQPIRVDVIADDTRSVGFPEGHPEMGDFLGVSIRVRGAVYGILYLANHPDGGFSEEDEQLVRALAGTAGFAIENARLYLETRRRQEWATASAEVTAQLLAPDGGDALSFVAERMRTLAGAQSAFVVLLMKDSDRLRVADVRGDDVIGVVGQERPLAGTFVERVISGRQPMRLDEHDVRGLRVSEADPFGPVLAVPLAGRERTAGALVLARASGQPSFSEADLEVAADFAGRASVAMELQAARSDAERVMLFEERGRIARDLHDRVIQQLFATGMQLQGVLGTLPPGRAAERVDAAVAALDSSISQIRRIIFTLESTARGPQRPTGRQRLFDLIEQLSEALSIEPSISVAGPVDAVLDGELAEDVLAVVNEGVTNAVKHGAASDVVVDVAVDAKGVTVTVSNDGLPLTDSGRRSGLGNLEERARRRSGTMRLEVVEGRTVLRWAVPLKKAGRSRAARGGDDDASPTSSRAARR